MIRYPEPKSSVAPEKNIDILKQHYDLLTTAGLYVLPKQANTKVPLTQFWRKENRVYIDNKADAIEFQKHDGVWGWCVVTGELSNRLIVLDFDTADLVNNGLDPVQEYERVQSLSRTDFVLGTPANGVHLYYRLPQELEMIGNKKLMPGVDIRGEGGQVVSLGGVTTYTGRDSVRKGVEDGHTGEYRLLEDGQYTEIPYMDKRLHDFISADKITDRRGESYGQTEVGLERISRHFKQPLEERERLVLECLKYILKEWPDDATYDQWLQMWMSAYHGSDGSYKIRDFILTHPKIYWWDGDNGKQHFSRAWDSHVQRDSGYTVSSLLWLARQHGWLSKTGYEIPDYLFEEIDVRYISEWLATLTTIPKRLLLMSQTGSGKTQSIKELYYRLNAPKTVIFVPSIKLATELANTLSKEHGLPAELYRDSLSGQTKDTVNLVESQILVSTLQTFSKKVWRNGYVMSDYGLVIVEESDQLLAQFARGGGSVYGSHVGENEARNGYATLRQALEQSDTVWFMDATMSQISLEVMRSMATDFSLVRNIRITPKSKVSVVDNEGTAFQHILYALEKGKQVVAVADTAILAEEIIETMRLLGHDGLLITRHTERYPEVIAFMEDVNNKAKEHRFICYNSVMASGVSIHDVKPDLIVQFCGYLTPRTNLQMLNRYRNQSKVICYYRTGENLYGREAIEVLEDAKIKLDIESGLVNIPVAIRDDDAQLRGTITAMSVADNELQNRAPREFYMNLLRADGRGVEEESSIPSAVILNHTREAVRNIKKEQKELIAKTWREVDPIDKDNPAPIGATPLQIAQGETHAEIMRSLRNNIPDEDNTLIYERVKSFGKYGFVLTSLIRQDIALGRAEDFLMDKSKAITGISNTVSLIKLVTKLHWLWNSLDSVLSKDIVKQRADVFMYELKRHAELYDGVVNRRSQKFEAVCNRSDSNEKLALDFSKIILSLVGLKQRTDRVKSEYVTSVVNYAEAQQFLEWRNKDINGFVPNIPLTTNEIDTIILNRVEAIEKFKNMTAQEQDEVMMLVAKETNTDFTTAVQSVFTKSSF